MQRPLDPRPASAIHRLANCRHDHASVSACVVTSISVRANAKAGDLVTQPRLGTIFFLAALSSLLGLRYSCSQRPQRRRVRQRWQPDRHVVAYKAIENFETFLLLTHRQRIGGRARQAEQAIPQLQQFPSRNCWTIAAAAHCQASIPACNSSRCRLMRVKLVLERSGKLLTMVAAVFYDIVSAHICSGVLANSVLSVMLYTLFADRRARGRPPR